MRKLEPPKVQNMREVMLRAIEELAKPYPSIRLTRWKIFNEIVGGFRMKEYSILCAPTGCGKTEWLANVSDQLIEQGVNHFVMSVETGETDFCKRVMGVRASQDLNHGDAIEADRIARITAEHDRHLTSDHLWLGLYDNRIPVEQLKYDIEYMRFHHECKVVFLDNLNFFMEATDNQTLEMDRVTHELIIFCKKVDVHIVMVMHPNKKNERVENEWDIKGSSTAVQEAHNVFLLNRPSKDGLKEGLSKSDRELKINKMRRRGRHVGKVIVYGHESNRYYEKGVYDPR